MKTDLAGMLRMSGVPTKELARRMDVERALIYRLVNDQRKGCTVAVLLKFAKATGRCVALIPEEHAELLNDNIVILQENQEKEQDD